MQHNCKPPECQYSDRWKKCVKPNAYNEALAWCKRNKVDHTKCKKDYNSEEAKHKACDRLEERIKLLSSHVSRIRRISQVPIASKPLSSKSLISSKKNSSSLKRKKAVDAAKTADAANKIQAFIKRRVIYRAETVANRTQYYNAVQYYLKDISDNHQCLKQIGMGTFEIGNKIRLVAKIGSKSKYGVVYHSGGKSVLLSVASKLMPANKTNKLEAWLNTNVTNIVLNNLSRHFLICYRTFKCLQSTKEKGLPTLIKGKSYYVALNELAHGDLKTLCSQKEFLRDTETVINVAIQIMLSVLTFHMMGYSHNDCHWGNFLYHNNKTIKGYYHYRVNGKDVYLKACKYNLMIYDYGFAKKDTIIGTSGRLSLDYRRILMAFIRNDDKGWITSKQLDATLSRYIKSLSDKILALSSDRMDQEEEMFSSVIMKSFLDCPQNRDILVDRMSASQIINKQPYIISRQHLDIPRINPFSSPMVS